MLRYFASSKYLKLFAKAAFTCGMFWLVLRSIDVALLKQMLHRQERGLLLAVVFLLLVQTVLGAFRWQMLLAALAKNQRRLSVSDALVISYISAFFNCCLPGALGGDVLRVWMSKEDGVPLTPAIHSVVIDRMIALITLVVLIGVMLPVLGGIMGFSAALVLPLMMAGLALGLAVLLNLNRLLNYFSHWRMVQWLLHFLGDVRLLAARPLVVLAALAYSMTAHLAYCMTGYVLAHSLGAEITAMQSVALLPPVLLATVLPLSIGGWGVREAGMVGMLGLLKVPSAVALMLSVQMGLIGILLSLPGGLLWLARKRRAQR